jgi:TonB family protein
MKVCFACQGSMLDDAEYCSTCGRIFGQPRAIFAKSSPAIPHQQLNTPRRQLRIPTKPSRTVWLIVLSLVAGTFALAAVINLQRRTGSDRSATTSRTTSSRSEETPRTSTTAAPVTLQPAVEPPSTSDPEHVYTSREVSEKMRLISKPEPSYTEEARQKKIWGTVVLRVVFTGRGTVENIRVISGLPYGLTERAIDSAKAIRFVPARKDGLPVSIWMQLEYNFNLY